MVHPAARLEPGLRLGPYELLLRIGQGGMASVWLAREDDKPEFVAIKTVLPEHLGDDALRTMMIDEALIAQAIAHENVARTLSIGELWGMPYLVLEYVPGQSLEQLCKGRASDEPLPPAVLTRLMVDTCAGLHAAHELTQDGQNLGLVHRDLSTHNVLVDERGRVKLIDFGIAKVNERLTKTASGLTKGKLPYMAPEQALGGTVDRRADLWSLGAVMCELLTGKIPFDGEDDNEGLMDKLSGEPHAPLPESVPAALRAVIDRSLAFKAADRYATAAELGEALAAAVPPAPLADVAELVRERLGPALALRKRAVEQALAAASARAEARELLKGGAPSSRRRVASPPPVKKERGSDPKLSARRADAKAKADAEADADQRMSRQSVAYVLVAAVALVVLAAYVLGSQAARQNPGPTDASASP